jgi:PHD/YefM family antitoxin component YafN of YafNO toxin-antitoxin module
MNGPVQFLTDKKGRKAAVVLDIAEYEKLLEDVDDLAIIAKRRGEETIPHAEFKKGLKRRALSH